jgi:hypothetical protein
MKGKYLKGDVPIQAYFQRNTREPVRYGPDRISVWYDIENDEYCAVVVVVPDESITTDKNLPIPRLTRINSSPVETHHLLSKGDVKIFQIPYKFPSKTHKATDPKKPGRYHYMVGNTILTALVGSKGGYDETFERVRVSNRKWEIYGHDVYENKTLDQAPHKHCLDLLNQTGDPNRTNFWTVDGYFSNLFKNWY